LFGSYSFTIILKDGDLLNPPPADGYGITILTNPIGRQEEYWERQWLSVEN